jgi:hypothetical protein
MASSIAYHFARGFGLGLLVGLILGYLASLAQKALGLPPGLLVYDLWVGAFFGLVAGWCFALQSLLKKTLHDLFRFLSTRVPWLTDALASQWLTHLREVFGLFTGKLQGAPRWLMTRFILTPLANVTPFRDAVARVRDRWKKPQAPTPEDLSFGALEVLLRPLDIAFLAAYALLFIGATLCWCIPFFTRGWP